MQCIFPFNRKCSFTLGTVCVCAFVLLNNEKQPFVIDSKPRQTGTQILFTNTAHSFHDPLYMLCVCVPFWSLHFTSPKHIHFNILANSAQLSTQKCVTHVSMSNSQNSKQVFIILIQVSFFAFCFFVWVLYTAWIFKMATLLSVSSMNDLFNVI